MLLAYDGTSPVFFRKEDIRRIEKNEVRREGSPEPVPAGQVTLLEGVKYNYLLDHPAARAAFREVLFQSMELKTAKEYFPEAWVD